MASPEAARQALAQMGATLARARHFEDNELFDDERHSLRARGRVLRLRHNDQGAQLTAKGPRRDVDGVKSRPEVEVGVGDGALARALLELLGYRRTFRYQKYREVWRWGDCEIVLDETPVGPFLEIEGPVDGIHAAARALSSPRVSGVPVTSSSSRNASLSWRKGRSTLPLRFASPAWHTASCTP